MGAIILVILGVVAAFWSFSRITQAIEARKNAVTLLIRADDLLAALRDAETGARGYALTGQESFLEPYLAVRDGIGGQFGELRQLTELSAGHKHIDALAPLIDARLAELASVIELRRKNDMAGVLATVGGGQGKRLMDVIRVEIRGFIHLEETVLAEREARLQSTLRRLFVVLITGSVFALLLALSLIFLADREARQRLKNQVHLETARLLGVQQEMSSQLRHSNATLLARDKELTASLKDNGDLKAALDEHAIVAMTDPKGKITFVNDKFCAISKYSRAELLGQDHRIISSGYHSKTFIRDLWATIASGRVWRGELKNKAKDGTFYWLDSTMVPFFDEQGKIRQYISIRADITERKLAEAAVHDSEERFRTMANSMSQLAWIARPDGFIFWYNLRWYEYTGKTPEEMEGWGWQSVHDPVALPTVVVNWTAAITAGTSFEMEFPLRGADGSFRSFLTRGEPLKNADGQVVQWFGTNTDVTSLKQAEEKVQLLNADLEQRVIDRTVELETANNELEAFSYSVAHDLRSPLRSIDGFSRLVLEDFSQTLPEPGQRFLKKIRVSAQTMGTLIDDLLSLARLSRQELNKQATDTHKLVRNVLTELGSPWSDRVVKISIGALPVSSGDQALLKQVWINLLSNALKYTRKRETAQIEIGSTQLNGVDTFFIRDNGTGFDMAYADKLFGTFQRLHSADDFEGTGIGLAIVKRIILRHGGRVWAEAAVDRGATFSFTLEKENQS